MQQLPISTHIVVLSHSGGKVPDTTANALPAGEGKEGFADLLAAQISAQDVDLNVNGIVAPGAGNDQAAPTDASALEAGVRKADEQATQQLAEVFSALPLPQSPVALPVDNAAGTGAKGQAEERQALAAVLPGSAATPVAQAPLAAEIKPETLPALAAKTAEEPAKIAATEQALPAKQALEVEWVDNKPTPLIPAHMPNTARVEAAPARTPQAAPVPMSVDVKVGMPGWDTAFSQRVAWAATNQHQVAELHLNPPNLGPVEIRITVANDQASAVFVSPHASVRDSIEAALPRLREMLGESGLTLGNVNVSSQSFQQQQHTGQGDEKSNARQGGAHSEHALIPDITSHNIASIAVGRQGLVDIFA